MHLTTKNLRRWRDILLMKVVTTFYRRGIFLVRSSQQPIKLIPDLHSRLEGLTIAVLTREEWDAYHALRPDCHREEIERRWERGDRCFACRHKGHIVDAGWVSVASRVPIPYLHRDLVLPHGYAFHYDAYTLPAYRAHGLYMARNCFVERCTRDEGCLYTAAMIAVENRLPQLALKRVGFVPAGIYYCVRFGSWQKVWGVGDNAATVGLPPLVPTGRLTLQRQKGLA